MPFFCRLIPAAMNCLVFHLGADRYAISSQVIEEVIAMVDLTALAGAPAEVAGEFNYHGTMVPVIDLCRLELGRPSSPRWSTRIIMLSCSPSDATPIRIGLITENATELAQFDPKNFVTAGEVSFIEDGHGRIRAFNLDSRLTARVTSYLQTHSPIPVLQPVPPDSPPVGATDQEPDEPVTDSVIHDMEPVRRSLKHPTFLHSSRQPRRVDIDAPPLKSADDAFSLKRTAQPDIPRRRPRSYSQRKS